MSKNERNTGKGMSGKGVARSSTSGQYVIRQGSSVSFKGGEWTRQTSKPLPTALRPDPSPKGKNQK